MVLSEIQSEGHPAMQLRADGIEADKIAWNTRIGARSQTYRTSWQDVSGYSAEIRVRAHKLRDAL